MRLKESEIKAIKSAICKYDKDALVYLFGSRVDDNKKGGDIDILVLSKLIKLREKLKIKTNLYKIIGEQKIDLISTPVINTEFLKYIYERSVKL
jgi:predicted nucleotidyltransferase